MELLTTSVTKLECFDGGGLCFVYIVVSCPVNTLKSPTVTYMLSPCLTVVGEFEIRRNREVSCQLVNMGV